MSVAFSSVRPRGKGEVTQQTIQKVTHSDAAFDWTCSGPDGECESASAAGAQKVAPRWLQEGSRVTGIVMLPSPEGAKPNKAITAM